MTLARLGDDAAMIAFCLSRLVRYKSPKEVRIGPSKSPIGKILCKDLRKEAHTSS